MPRLQIDYDPLPSQAKVFYDDTTDTIMHAAGLGSGKSYNLVMKMIRLSQLNQGYSGGILCPSYADFKRDIWPAFQTILEENRIPYRYHTTDKTFKFPWTRGLLYCFTAEKPIAGPNLAYCGVNEFSLIAYERISEMLRRVRVKNAKHKQKILVGTPDDVHGWLDMFIEQQMARGDDKFRLVNANTAENTYLDPQYARDLEYLLDERSLKVFRDGVVGRSGSDYFYYAYDDSVHVSEIAQYHKDLPIHVGLDFNVGKMAVSFSHKIGDNQHFFDEMLLSGDSNTYTAAQEIKKRYPIHMCTISCDSAGKNRQSAAKLNLISDVLVLRSEGYNVRFYPQNPRLRYRQLLVNGMLSKNRILINPKCKHLRRDLKNVRQNSDLTKDEGKDNLLSHFSDGMDYVLCFEHEMEIMQRKSSQISY